MKRVQTDLMDVDTIVRTLVTHHKGTEDEFTVVRYTFLKQGVSIYELTAYGADRKAPTLVEQPNDA